VRMESGPGVGRDDLGTSIAEIGAEIRKWHTRDSLGANMRAVGSGIERSAKQ